MTRILVIAGDVYTAAGVIGTVAGEEARSRAQGILLGRGLSSADPRLAQLPFGQIALADGVALTDDVDQVGSRLLPHLSAHDATLLLDSSQVSRDLAGWLAAHLDARLFWAVEAVECAPGGTIRVCQAANGGHTRLVHRVSDGGRNIVLTRPNGIEPQPATDRGEPMIEMLAVEPIAERVQKIVSEDTDTSRHDLQTAQVVIGVGLGVGDSGNLPLFRELAEAAGGQLVGTRAVVDRGWLPFSRQVGQTGVSVSPDLYIGFGVSGAVQHQVGIRDSRRIVAVNTDPSAPLCTVADLVIEADAVEVARSLLANLATQSGAD